MENWLIIAGKGLKKINDDIKKIHQSKNSLPYKENKDFCVHGYFK
jgi:hypothetical protein